MESRLNPDDPVPSIQNLYKSPSWGRGDKAGPIVACLGETQTQIGMAVQRDTAKHTVEVYSSCSRGPDAKCCAATQYQVGAHRRIRSNILLGDHILFRTIL